LSPVSIVIVSWNVQDLLRRCLESILASGSGAGAEIVVVDNASSDGAMGMVRKRFPQVRLVVNQSNLGFAAACNQGMRLAGGRYVMLLNPDTEMRGDAIDRMVSYLDEHPEVGMVGPKLLNPDGSIQSSRRRFPTLATAFVESTMIQQYLPNSPELKRFYMLDRSDDTVQEVDWLVGACLMARREVVRTAGVLDESFFMYYEEVDWCYRIRKAGWSIVYLPGAEVIHYYGGSSQKDLSRRHINFNTSKYRFFRKHHGRVKAELLRVFLLANYLFQIIDEGAKLAVGHKPLLRRERLALLWEVVRSGFKG
ncbi:MAG: glycosyltransferase family 2 protein, partial [Chloroflexi bacterium]|nr:glycosyltransferase family 2 protein [Chloroflexota bacterium]